MRTLLGRPREWFPAVAALAATFVQLLVAFHADDLRQSLADFGGSPPLSTRIAVSSPWLFGTPLVLVGALAATWMGLARRPRARFATSVALAVAAGLALGFTHWALRQPLVQMDELLRP